MSFYIVFENPIFKMSSVIAKTKIWRFQIEERFVTH